MAMRNNKFFLLLVVCMAIVACDNGNNLNGYKEKVLDALSQQAGLPKEMFVKDYEVVVDSMSLIPITVEDSIKIILNIDSYKKSIENKLSDYKARKRTLFYPWDEDDTKKVQELNEQLVSIENAKSKLAEYEMRDKDEVLIKVFRCWIAIKLPIHGRQADFAYAIFSKDDEFITTTDSNMENYIEKNILK